MEHSFEAVCDECGFRLDEEVYEAGESEEAGEPECICGATSWTFESAS